MSNKTEIKKMTLEENTVFADEVLKPIILIIDQAIPSFDIDRLKATLDEMHSRASTCAAFPFPETMDKADNISAMNKLFECVINLLEARAQQQKTAADTNRRTAGEDILSALGF